MSSKWEDKKLDILNDFWYKFNSVSVDDCEIENGIDYKTYLVIFYRKNKQEKFVMKLNFNAKSILYMIYVPANKVRYIAKQIKFDTNIGKWSLKKTKHICEEILKTVKDQNYYNFYNNLKTQIIENLK